MYSVGKIKIDPHSDTSCATSEHQGKKIILKAIRRKKQIITKIRLDQQQVRLQWPMREENEIISSRYWRKNDNQSRILYPVNLLSKSAGKINPLIDMQRLSYYAPTAPHWNKDVPWVRREVNMKVRQMGCKGPWMTTGSD